MDISNHSAIDRLSYLHIKTDGRPCKGMVQMQCTCLILSFVMVPRRQHTAQNHMQHLGAKSYFYQIQGMLAITKHSCSFRCSFIVWTPCGFLVEWITFDSKFWEEAKSKLIRFYKMAILPEFALPRHTSGQTIHEPFLPVIMQ